MVPCVVGLLCTTLLLVEREARRDQRSHRESLQVLARIIASNSTAAVAFGDRDTAREILRALAGRGDVLSARLEAEGGELFADYSREPANRPLSSIRAATGVAVDGDVLIVTEPVAEGGRRFGTLQMRASRAELRRARTRTLLIAGAAMLASLGVAFALAWRIQRLISGPILELAATTKRVRQEEDFSLRAPRHGDDEIGFLIDSFNAMLDRVEGRERELAETNRELATTQERFELAVRGTDDGLWDWNASSRTAWYSDRFKSLLGHVPEAEVRVLEDPAAFVHPDDLAVVVQAVDSHRTAGQAFDIEARLHRAGGGYSWMRIRGMAAADSQSALRIAGSIQDVTRRKLAEHERERLLRAVEEKNRELEQIIYVTSHDLRSPLVNIQGFSKELQLTCEEIVELAKAGDGARIEEVIARDLPEILGFIQGSASKMERLLAGLLKLSRLGRAALDVRPLDMNALVGSVLAEFGYAAKGAGVELVADPDLPPCWGDEVQVNQVFSNLVSNAIKYRAPDRASRVRISGVRIGAHSAYCVEDNGLGIAPLHQEKVFEVFHRLDPVASEGEGLGLTIVRKSLERQGGTIAVESEVGVGSRFIVTMPAFDPARILDLVGGTAT